MHSVEPDLKLGGFSLWVFGHQYPNATDYWDGNWLNVRARVEAPGAVVQAQGALVFAPELAGPQIFVAARYDIVTAGENWVTVVASGVPAGLSGTQERDAVCNKPAAKLICQKRTSARLFDHHVGDPARF